MKKFSKMLSVVMALVMCLTMVCTAVVCVNAAEGATITLGDDIEDTVGTAVSIPVTATNFSTVAGFQFTVNTGELTDVTVEAADVLASSQFVANYNASAKTLKVVASNQAAILASDEATVIFTISANLPATAGTTTVTLSNGVFTNAAEKDVDVDLADTLTATAKEVVIEHEWSEVLYKYEDGNCITYKECGECDEVDVIATIANVAPLHAPILTSSLSMDYAIAKANYAGYTDIYAVFVKEGFDVKGVNDGKTVTVNAVDAGDYAMFSFTDISAKQMSNKIDVKIYGTDASGNVVLLAQEDDYSLVKYIETQYNKDEYLNAEEGTVEAAFRTLLVDLANYGAAAQDYLGYNKEAPANANIPQTYASAEPSEYVNLLAESGDVKILKAPVLGNTVSVDLAIAQESVAAYGEDVSVVIDYVDTTGAAKQETINYADLKADGSYYLFNFNKISAATMQDKFTVTVKSGDTELGKLEYSVESYCYTVAWYHGSVAAYEEVLPLTKALTVYGRSADAYLNFGK